MRLLSAASALLLAGAFLPALAAGQTVGVGPVVQAYQFDNATAAGIKSIQLISTPFAVTVPVMPTLAVAVSGAYARGVAKAEGGEQVTLQGLTDTNIDVTFGVGLDWLIVTAGASLPTGNNTHSLEESLVAGVVAAELLPFAVNTWGSGGNAGATVAAARQVGSWGLGLSAGYRVASEYEPLQSQTLSYRPGDQLQLRVALDRDVGTSGTFSVLFGAQRYGNDQISGSELFRSGLRLDAIVSYAFALGLRSSALVYGGVNHRANGTLLQQESALGGATDTPAQQLFLAGADVRLPVGRRAALRPTADLRVFRAEDGASQGWISAVGVGFDYRVAGTNSGRRLVLTPSAKARFGRVIVSDDLETGVVGWEAGLTLGVGLGR